MSGERSQPALPLTIEKIVGRGLGLAHAEGKTWFVAGALPGERVLARPTLHRRGVVEATAVELLENPHPARHRAPCPHAAQCGGCDWPHVTPQPGAALKARVAAESARVSPQLAAALAAAPVTASPSAYRLRARLHWAAAEHRLGFFAQRSRRVVEIAGCRVISRRLEAALPQLEAALAARCPRDAELEWIEDLEGERALMALRASQGGPGLEPAHLPAPHDLENVVAGCHLLDRKARSCAGWGEQSLHMALPVPLELPLGCFFQGNRHLVPWLFARAAELAGPDAVPTWDLHAGVGLLAAAAQHAAPRELVLVEPFAASAEAAARNLPSAQVAVGRTAEAFLRGHRSLPRRALVITDPPRSGLSRELRQALAAWRPERLLMVACDPATWARDAAFLIEHGMTLNHLELVDLFPSTHHVEVLAVLEAR